MVIYVKIPFISIFSIFFLIFKNDSIRCVDFTHIAASNKAGDDVTIKSDIEYLIHTYYILVLIL